MILQSGILNLNKNILPVQTLKYLYKVYKKAGVEAIDIFYRENESLYICCESYEINMVSMYRIDLSTNSNTGNLITNSDEENDFDFEDFNIFEDNSELEIENPESNIIKSNPMLKFSTVLSFLECITITDECEVIVDKDITIRSKISQFKLPRLRPLELDKYIDIMSIDELSNKWEKVNVKNIKLISNVVSRTRKSVSDMYVALEGNSIYSDNKDVIFETPSWNVKDNYTFNYSMIESLRIIPEDYEVMVAKSDGKLMLKVEDIYIGWGESVEMSSDNIMSFLDMSKFQNIMMLPLKELYKFNLMETFTKIHGDKLELRVTETHIVQLARGDNLMHIIGEGIPGYMIRLLDSEKFLQLLKSCGSDKPVISIDPSLKDSPTVLIEGQVNILTSLEDFMEGGRDVN